MRRTVVAFIVSGLAPAILTSIVGWNGAYHPLALLVVVGGAAYALQVVVGIPVHFLIRRRKHGLVLYVVTGLTAALVPFLLHAANRWEAEGATIELAIVPTLYVGFLGVLAGATFWLVARPDRTAVAAVPR